jgi:hypothetical protein
MAERVIVVCNRVNEELCQSDHIHLSSQHEKHDCRWFHAWWSNKILLSSFNVFEVDKGNNFKINNWTNAVLISIIEINSENSTFRRSSPVIIMEKKLELFQESARDYTDRGKNKTSNYKRRQKHFRCQNVERKNEWKLTAFI